MAPLRLSSQSAPLRVQPQVSIFLRCPSDFGRGAGEDPTRNEARPDLHNAVHPSGSSNSNGAQSFRCNEQDAPRTAAIPPLGLCILAACGRYSGGDVLILIGLVAVGFSLPYLLSHAGSMVQILATYAIPAAIAFVAIAYEPSRKDGARQTSRGTCD